MPVDLHLHSSVSDGTDTPTQLVDKAAAAGLDTIALTDHDTMDGIAEARARAADVGVRLIPGIELSVTYDGTKMHMLVYFTEPGTEDLEVMLEGLRRGRLRRNERILERLTAQGYDITPEDVSMWARGPSVGRPHIADALVHKGYFATRDEVFKDVLRDGGSAYVRRTGLTARDAISKARDVGAVTVIAHPITIGKPEGGYEAMYRELADLGLGGIEAHHPLHSLELRAHLEHLAGSIGLVATGGSDYHGTGKRDYRIGVGRGDLRVPASAVDEIEAKRFT